MTAAETRNLVLGTMVYCTVRQCAILSSPQLHPHSRPLRAVRNHPERKTMDLIHTKMEQLAQETGDEFFYVERKLGDGTYAAMIRSGHVAHNSPVFTADGEECLFATGASPEQACQRLAIVCGLATIV